MSIDELIPPPDGEIIISPTGAVLMSRTTYEKLSDTAEEAEIIAGRTGEE